MTRVMRRAWLVLIVLGLGLACSGRSTRQGDRDGAGGGGRGGTSVGAGRGQGASPGAGGSVGATGGTGGAMTGGTTGGSAMGANGGVATGGASGMGASSGSGGTGKAGSGDGGAAGEPQDAPECAIAIRYDECCSEPRPVTRAEFDADPCYAEVRSYAPGFGREVKCEPIPCPAIVCPTKLTSRVTKVVDIAGKCEFTDECATNDDCVLAQDTSRCCECPLAFPKVVVDEFECVRAASSSAPACNSCATVDCDACAEEARAPVCLFDSQGPHTCGFAPPPQDGVADNQCTAEHACVVGSTPGIACFPPDEQVCGGPAPPPDECANDGDCGDFETDGLVCEPVGYCHRKVCVAGCAGDDVCKAWESCDTSHRCVTGECLEDDCGENHVCTSGLCMRIECSSGSECPDGFCVRGRCHEDPGSCVDTFAP